MDQVLQSEGVVLGNEYWLVPKEQDIFHDWLHNRVQLPSELFLVLRRVKGLQTLDLFLEAPTDNILSLRVQVDRNLYTKWTFDALSACGLECCTIATGTYPSTQLHTLVAHIEFEVVLKLPSQLHC